MLASLHTANQNAIADVCAPHNDKIFAGWQNANMDSTERNFLGSWRKHRGLSQEELAEKVGTTKSVVSLLENERRPLSSTWLRKFAAVLDTQPGHLLDVDPTELDNDIIDIWTRLDRRDRKQAAKVLRTFLKTGTDH